MASYSFVDFWVPKHLYVISTLSFHHFTNNHTNPSLLLPSWPTLPSSCLTKISARLSSIFAPKTLSSLAHFLGSLSSLKGDLKEFGGIELKH